MLNFVALEIKSVCVRLIFFVSFACLPSCLTLSSPCVVQFQHHSLLPCYHDNHKSSSKSSTACVLWNSPRSETCGSPPVSRQQIVISHVEIKAALRYGSHMWGCRELIVKRVWLSVETWMRGCFCHFCNFCFSFSLRFFLFPRSSSVVQCFGFDPSHSSAGPGGLMRFQTVRAFETSNVWVFSWTISNHLLT